MTDEHSKRFGTPAGHVALDFVNTLDGRWGTPEERLKDYFALVAWTREKRLLSELHCNRLIETSYRTPGRGTNILQDAIKLREALYQIFTAIVDRRVVPQNALGILNLFLMEGSSYVRLANNGRHFEWDWLSSNHALNSMLWPLARAAADLLASEDVGRIRQCAAEDCAWFFLDTTRNARKRWCDMKSCGNRVKARRHYQKVRTAGSP